MLVNRPLNPDGAVAPFSCAGPVPSSGDPIGREVYLVDLSDPLLPRDQRIEVQVHSRHGVAGEVRSVTSTTSGGAAMRMGGPQKPAPFEMTSVMFPMRWTPVRTP